MGRTTGIITNEGFRDIFLIGRGNVPPEHMYDFQYQRPPSLVRRRHTAGVRGRLDYRGRVVEELDLDSVLAAAGRLVEDRGRVDRDLLPALVPSTRPTSGGPPRSIREAYPQVSVSVSTDIVREHREYERTSTAVLDAYIRPIFERYVDELEQAAGRARLRRAAS